MLASSKTYWFSKKAKPTSCCRRPLASFPISDSNALEALVSMVSSTGIDVTAPMHSIVPEKKIGAIIGGCCVFALDCCKVSGMANKSVCKLT